ncbi:hypothetical protein [Capnocytophaga leadbetteri]|nr:hypothetical protein [Capnocytophaga leadbetteri]
MKKGHSLSTLWYIFAAEKEKIKLFLAKRDIYPEKICIFVAN